MCEPAPISVQIARCKAACPLAVAMAPMEVMEMVAEGGVREFRAVQVVAVVMALVVLVVEVGVVGHQAEVTAAMVHQLQPQVVVAVAAVVELDLMSLQQLPTQPH